MDYGNGYVVATVHRTTRPGRQWTVWTPEGKPIEVGNSAFGEHGAKRDAEEAVMRLGIKEWCARLERDDARRKHDAAWSSNMANAAELHRADAIIGELRKRVAALEAERDQLTDQLERAGERLLGEDL